MASIRYVAIFITVMLTEMYI